MVLSIASRKWASALLVLALPLAATGCQSTGGGWGWSPWSSTPSFSSLNPWKSSSNSVASSTKPSNQVPTPPASMLSGSGLAKSSQGGAPTYNANTYGGSRPTGGYTASTNDYGTRQVSATQGEGGYNTGPYATGGGATAQTGPYNASATSNPYGAAATADRRSDAAYGAGNTAYGAANTGGTAGATAYGAASNTTGGYGATPSYGGYPAATSGQSGYGASPYAGTTGQSSGPSAARGYAGGSTTTYTGTDGYRPGSTGRTSAEIQKAGFANQGSAASDPTAVDYGSSYPTTGAGDESAYR